MTDKLSVEETKKFYSTEEIPEQMKQALSFMRQWLIEDRKATPTVTARDLWHWLESDYNCVLTQERDQAEREKEEAVREKLKALGLSRKMKIAETDFALSQLRKGQPELTMEDIKLHNAEAEGFNLGFEEAMKNAIEALTPRPEDNQ